MATCPKCHAVTDPSAGFCSSCGSFVVEDNALATGNPNESAFNTLPPPPSQKPQMHPLKTALRIFALLAIVVVGGLVTLMVIFAIKGSPVEPAKTPESSVASQDKSSPVIASARPQIAPPKYRMIHQTAEWPGPFIVAVGTTDDELKSLLWDIRDKIRSHSYKDLGLNEPSQSNRQYLSGMIEVFRGPKCAPETYNWKSSCALKSVCPCGDGDHNAGYYQWGLGGHYDEDEAGIFSSDRNLTIVFDAKDGYKLPANLQAKLDAETQNIEAEARIQKAARELLAKELQVAVRNEGFHIDIDPGSEDGELVMISDLFEKDLGRATFLSEVLPGWRSGLCSVGYTNVTLKTGVFSIGDNYQVGCKLSVRH
jgi:hypothetical protein